MRSAILTVIVAMLLPVSAGAVKYQHHMPGNALIKGQLYVVSGVTLGATVTLANGETMDNATDDFIEFQGSADSTDPTDIRVDLDGTYPIWSSPTDTNIGFAENVIVDEGVTVGGGYGFTGASISSAGVGQFNGALTTDGALTALSAAVGGGYGSTGCSMSDAGVIQCDGNADFAGGVDVSVGALTMTGTSIDLDPTGAFALDMDANQAVTITLDDMDAGLVVQAAGLEDLLVFNYSAGTKSIILGNATDNPLITQLGTGQVTFPGNVDATNGLNVTVAALTAAAGITASAGEVLVSGGNAQLNDGIVLSFGSADDVACSWVDATQDMLCDNTSATGSWLVGLGTDTAATDWQIINNSLAALLTVEGDGDVSLAGTGGATATPDFAVAGYAQFSGTTELNGALDADSTADFGGGVTNSAGEHLFSGGNLQINDDLVCSYGSSDDVTLAWVDATADFLVDNTVATGSTLLRLGTDTAATDLQIQNDSAAALFTVTGAGQATFSGDLDMAAGSIDPAEMASSDFGDWTCAAGVCDVDADVLDFTELADALALDAATSITGTAAEILTITRSLTDASDEEGVVIEVTASDTTSGATEQFGLVVVNDASTEGLDAGIVIANDDIDDAVGAALLIVSAGGGYINLINAPGLGFSVSGAGAVTASDIITGAGTIDATEIADKVTIINIPITAFQGCGSADDLLNFDDAADAFPDYSRGSGGGTQGSLVIDWDVTGGSVDNEEVCTTIIVPPDYVSGGAFYLTMLDTATNDHEYNHTTLIQTPGAAEDTATAATTLTNGTGASTTTTTCDGATDPADLYTCIFTTEAITAGAIVTFQFGSDGTSTEATALFGGEFRYTAAQ